MILSSRNKIMMLHVIPSFLCLCPVTFSSPPDVTCVTSEQRSSWLETVAHDGLGVWASQVAQVVKNLPANKGDTGSRCRFEPWVMKIP